MPRTTPTRSWEDIRIYAEKFSWIDPKTGVRVTGFNPPAEAKGKEQVPYYVRAIAIDGHLIEGQCITLKLNRQRLQRLVKFIPSNECRWLRDYLIISIDGVRFVTQ